MRFLRITADIAILAIATVLAGFGIYSLAWVVAMSFGARL